MHKKFEINQTEIKGGCLSGRLLFVAYFGFQNPVINKYEQTQEAFTCDWKPTGQKHGQFCTLSSHANHFWKNDYHGQTFCLLICTSHTNHFPKNDQYGQTFCLLVWSAHTNHFFVHRKFLYTQRCHFWHVSTNKTVSFH